MKCAISLTSYWSKDVMNYKAAFDGIYNVTHSLLGIKEVIGLPLTKCAM